MQGNYGDTQEAVSINIRRFDDWRAQIEVSQIKIKLVIDFKHFLLFM